MLQDQYLFLNMMELSTNGKEIEIRYVLEKIK